MVRKKTIDHDIEYATERKQSKEWVEQEDSVLIVIGDEIHQQFRNQPLTNIDGEMRQVTKDTKRMCVHSTFPSRSCSSYWTMIISRNSPLYRRRVCSICFSVQLLLVSNLRKKMKKNNLNHRFSFQGVDEKLRTTNDRDRRKASLEMFSSPSIPLLTSLQSSWTMTKDKQCTWLFLWS